MRLLWVLLFVGASVATVTAQDSIEDFTDAELVDISEREPEPMDEPGEDGVDEDGDQSCRGDEDQKQDDDDDNDDDDDDDSDSHGMEKRHHRHQHHHRGHHHRHHPHHHHHRRHHHKHHRHGRHGRQGICRRQFCKCKKRAGKDCRQVIRCFMRMAFCVRKRRCHMQPHHGYRLRTLGRDKWARKGTFHPKGKPHPTRHPHPRRQECKHNFTECLNDTDRGNCKAKLKCVIQLKHCMRRGNCSHFKHHPYPTLEGPEELNDFHDDELVDVPDEDSLLEEEDEERHRNHTRRGVSARIGFCRHEFRRCQNRTGDDCRKKFHCFIRMAHCIRCSHGGFKGPIRLGGFKRPEMKRPWSIDSFKRGGKFDYLTKRNGFGGMTPFGYKRKTGAGKFAGIMKWDMERSFGKNPWIRRPPVYRPQRRHTASEKPWKMGLVYTRRAGARLFARVKKSWQTMQKYRVKPWIRRPFIYRRPHPSRRPTPTKKGKGECKQDLDKCLKKADTKDCSKKFKCYFKFLYCVRRMWHHPMQGHD